METYREKLKAQNVIIMVCITILVAFSALNIAAECGIVPFGPSVGDSHWQARWRGFCTGASFGILALLVYGLIANLRALKNDKQLKKLFIPGCQNRKENSLQLFQFSILNSRLYFQNSIKDPTS